MLDTKLLATASLEAIYWWNRTEGYYHQHFSKIEDYVTDEELLKFFSQKLFEVFLREYSIRRNISSGKETPLKLLNYLNRSNFYARITEGDISAIDETSANLKENSVLTNNRECRSLLSKLAFLINPSVFSLYDQYALDSLYRVLKPYKKITRNKLDSYRTFITHSSELIEENSTFIEKHISDINLFEGSPALEFFTYNKAAYKRRVFDKFLWLYKVNESTEIIDNSAYDRFYKHQENQRVRLLDLSKSQLLKTCSR